MEENVTNFAALEVRKAGCGDKTPAVEEIQALLDRERGEWRKERESFLLRELFWKAGGRDPEYLVYRFGGEAEFGEGGELLNGEALAEKAKEETPEQFAGRKLRLEGVRPQEGSSPMPDKRDFSVMGYRRRAELWERDPELYKRLVRNK